MIVDSCYFVGGGEVSMSERRCACVRACLCACERASVRACAWVLSYSSMSFPSFDVLDWDYLTPVFSLV